LDVVGIIPAAGMATRLSPIPCSKEILPIGIEQWGDKPYKRPKVAIQYLLECMRAANITKTYIVIRENKWDIPAFLGDGKMMKMDIAYLMMGLPYGAPFSVNQAYPFITSSIVALGYPDILIKPQNVYNVLIEKLTGENADLVLGLYEATNPQKMDMIEFDGDHKISRISIKPKHTHLQYTYVNAIWTPAFSKFMYNYITEKQDIAGTESGAELYMGDIFQAFINEGNIIQYSIINDGSYFDIGTVDEYLNAILKFSKT
jgi:glucose-1-phosphate thymidylyltransferase